MNESFIKEYRDVKLQNTLINQIASWYTEKLTEEKRVDILNVFNESLSNFEDRYGSFLYTIWCELVYSTDTFLEWLEARNKHKMYISLKDSIKLVNFLGDNKYTDDLKDQVLALVYLYISDQIKNNYDTYVKNDFLDIFPYRDKIFDSNQSKLLTDIINSARWWYLHQQVQIDKINSEVNNDLSAEEVVWFLNLDTENSLQENLENEFSIISTLPWNIPDKNYLDILQNKKTRIEWVKAAIEEILIKWKTSWTGVISSRDKQEKNLIKSKTIVSEYLNLLDQKY